jgi:hypothetical protein
MLGGASNTTSQSRPVVVSFEMVVLTLGMQLQRPLFLRLCLLPLPHELDAFQFSNRHGSNVVVSIQSRRRDLSQCE